MTYTMPDPIEDEEGCAQVVLIEPLLGEFQALIRQRGCYLAPMPGTDPDELPTYFVAISPERWKEANDGLPR